MRQYNFALVWGLVGGFTALAFVLGLLLLSKRQVPDPVPTAPPQHLNSAQDFFSRAKLAINAGDPKGAIADLEEATRRDDTLFPAWVALAEIHSQGGNLSKAEACYTKAIEAEPNSAPVLANRATLRLSLGRPDEALLDLNQAIIAEPGFALGLMTRGMLLLDRGKIDEALADFEAVIKASPELADGYLARGLVKKNKGDLEWAEKDIRKAATISPGDFTMQANLALILAKRGKQTESDRAFADAIRLNPNGEKGLRENLAREKK